MRNFSYLILVLVLLLLGPAAIAQQDLPLSWDTLDIDEVVVTGTRIEVARKNVPMSLSMLSAQTLERSGEFSLLPVISQQVPGVFVTERGVTGFGVAEGAAGGITIRGVGGSPNTQVLMLIDGHPQYMGIFGHPLADSYVTSDAERVEIIRGPASILYGSNAMGGVINIITKKQQKEGFSGSAMAKYGSFNTQKYMANAGYRKNKFHVFASVNYNSTNGHRDSSDFEILNGYFKTGYAFTDNLNAVADVNLANFNATDPGIYDMGAGDRIDILRGMASFTLTNNFETIEGALKFFHNFGEHDITSGFHSEDFNTGINFYQSLTLLPGNVINFGYDYKTFGGIAENTFGDMVFGDTSIYEQAGYMFIQQQLFAQLILNAGLRLESNSVYGTEWIPQAGFAYNPITGTTFKGSVSKGFRSPTIRELFLFPPANGNLKPERMINYELGYLQDIGTSEAEFELTAFYSTGSNLIQVEGQFPSVSNENTGEFANFGLETQIKVPVGKNLQFSGNYTFIEMEKPVLATPKHSLFIGSYLTLNKFMANLSFQYIDQIYTRLMPEASQSSYGLLDARVSYKVLNNTILFVSGKNLTNNEGYEINYGYPMPGITAFVGIKINY